ncbi:hypothetical protein ACFL23_00860 [Patescibacteria group bacterium]
MNNKNVSKNNSPPYPPLVKGGERCEDFLRDSSGYHSGMRVLCL